MNKQTLVQEIVTTTPNVIKHGKLNEKILLELKMMTSLYEYIEVVTNYFDDVKRPNFNNWTDVEGMGYGWIWMNYEEKNWHKMMGRIVADECNYLLTCMQDVYYMVYENERCKTYHFININPYGRTDILVGLSNEEIWF